MQPTKIPAARRPRRALVPPALVMALWRLRVHWRLLLATGVGLIAAVMLVCTVPLFARVALSAGLRDAVRTVPESGDIVVTLTTSHADPASLSMAQSIATSDIRRDLGDAVTSEPDLKVQTINLPVSSGGKQPQPSGASLAIFGLPIDRLKDHATLSAGQWPQPRQGALEIALPAEAAHLLNVQSGATFSYAPSAGSPPLALRVSGIFTITDPLDPYWHGAAVFAPMAGSGNTAAYPVLADASALLTTFNAVIARGGSISPDLAPRIFWYFTLRIDRLDSSRLDGLVAGLQHAQDRIPADLNALPGVLSSELQSPASDTLQTYQAIIFVAQIPIGILLIQMLALVLTFISLMSELLVEHQSEAIAILRSRGASRGQIFGALMAQGLGLGVLALVVGPPLALLVAGSIARLLLHPVDQAAIGTISTNPLTTLLDLRWYALAAAGVAIAAMFIALRRATQLDVLALRRETARTTRRPFWVRLNLDLVFGAIAIIGYALYTYVLSSGLLDPRAQRLLSPLALIAPFFILLAGTLFALRALPWLLERAAWLAARGRGAAAMLALAQSARSPQQVVRTTLLLSLAVAFALFTLTFTASQNQRLRDTTDFAVGADFAGNLPTLTAADQPSLADQTAQFRAIPGVLGTSLGYRSNTGISAGALFLGGTPLVIRAVDADTYATVGIWSPTYSANSLASTLADLAAQRTAAIASNSVPVYVDDAAWQTLHLSQGAHFSSPVPGYNEGMMHFIVAGRVHLIPGVYDRAVTDPNAPQFGAAGGLLADYTTYAGVYARDLKGSTLAPNVAWLRTAGDAGSLATVRTGLANGTTRLENLLDRRALLDDATSSPFQLNLIGVLATGAATALVLAIFGDLLAAWLSARRRVTIFAVLRALGAGPRQIAATLFIELGVIFTISLALGILLGAVLSSSVLPALVFSNLISARDQGASAFFLGQNIPPIHAIIPWTQVGIALGAIALSGLVALGLMTSIITGPGIARALRLSED